MIAIKYRADLAFQWPEKIRKKTNELPQGFEEIIDQATYDQMIANNQASFDQWKADQEAQSAIFSEKDKFRILRETFQDLADELAVENIGKGITTAGKSKEVADAFRDVVYYLNANTPSEAIAALNAVTPIPTFFEQNKKDELIAAFSAKVNELWPQS